LSRHGIQQKGRGPEGSKNSSAIIEKIGEFKINSPWAGSLQTAHVNFLE
jgi:hypothetical protein